MKGRSAAVLATALVAVLVGGQQRDPAHAQAAGPPGAQYVVGVSGMT